MKPKTEDRPTPASAPTQMRGEKRKPRAKANREDKPLFCRGRRVITEAEMAGKDCPFPPEPEWVEEWARWKAEQTAR